MYCTGTNVNRKLGTEVKIWKLIIIGASWIGNKNYGTKSSDPFFDNWCVISISFDLR